MDEPGQHLPREARSYWRATGALGGSGLLLAAVVFGGAGAGGLGWLTVAAAAVAAGFLVAVLPELLWRRWRYAIRTDEIDLVRGAFVVRRTLIPIRRVQHVDTESGPLQGVFGLATVTFHTAAGGVEIPALRRAEAERVRAQVAELARTRDDT